jgi:hypothetical protein
MAPKPKPVRLVVVLALVAIFVAITMWQSNHKKASAGPPSNAIYRAQHLNLF